MRCPKCGYISFDHIDTCLKCNKDITGVAEIEGTTYHAAPPSFLKIPEKNSSEIEVEPEATGTSGIAFEENDTFSEEEYDFSDPELDSLDVGSEEDEGTISFDGTGTEDFLLEPEDESNEEGNFEFELDDDEDSSAVALNDSPILTLPDELEDITDLTPPKELESEALNPIATKLTIDDELELGDDLDSLDFDLGLGDSENISDAEVSLSLDDLGLSVEDIVEEDDDLDELACINMDLEIDTLAPPSGSSKDKSSDSLDDIFLSLD